jgi:hypothetical protein
MEMHPQRLKPRLHLNSHVRVEERTLRNKSFPQPVSRSSLLYAGLEKSTAQELARLEKQQKAVS